MKKPFLKYIFSMLLFGSNGIVAHYINLSSYEIVLLRTLIGSILLAVIFFSSKGKLTFYKHKKEFIYLCISGISMGASWMFLYEAYNQVGVSIASLAYYCGPVIVMILSPVLFKEKLTVIKLIGFLCVVAGILLVNINVNNEINKWGIFCGLMSAVMYSFMVIFNKKAKGIKGLENSTLQLITSFIAVAVFVFFKQGFTMHIEASSIIPILILGVINTGFGCYLYFSSIGRLPVQSVAICSYLEAVSAVVFSVIFLNETMTPLQLVGAVLVIGGAVFGEYFSGKSFRKVQS